MKKIALLLVIILLTSLLSFSQTTYPQKLNDTLVVLTIEQVKLINQDIVLLNKQKEEINLLNLQLQKKDGVIEDYQKLINSYTLQDTMYRSQILAYRYYISTQDDMYNEMKLSFTSQNKQLKKSNIRNMTITLSIGVLLFLTTVLK